MKTKEVRKASDVSKVADVNGFLLNHFRNTGYTAITDWFKGERINLSHETASSVMFRNRKCGLMAFLQLAIALEIPNEEIAHILKEVYDDQLIWRRLETPKLGMKEQVLINQFHALSDAKQQLILNMVEEL